MVQATHVTIAASTGLVRLALLSHFATGLLGLAAGAVAVVVVKGGRLHRRSGIVFVYSMILTMVVAMAIAGYEGKVQTMIGAPFFIYLIFTGLTTVRPLPGATRGLNVGLMLLAAAFGIANYAFGLEALRSSRGTTAEGVPVPMIFFLGTIGLLAAIGDLRMIRGRELRGAPRIARHLWRMCYGLFAASGSFFLGQVKFIPAPLRIMPLLGALAVAPLAALLYWMWRVRIRKALRGLVIAKPLDHQPATGD